MDDNGSEPEPLIEAETAVDAFGAAVGLAKDAAVQASASSNLVLAKDTAVATKARFAAAHSQVARATQQAMAKHEAAKAEIENARRELEAKLRAMNAELEPLRALAARLEDGISAVNLYLGRDEFIEEFRDGASAAADVPLTIRQQVLSMDEEAALLAEDGGLDFRNIGVFTAWLLETPEHLDQVLPEQRGVVAIMARHTAVDYGLGAIGNAHMNEANFKTWWLLRNGERLYLMTTDFSVGTRVVPTADEFTSR